MKQSFKNNLLLGFGISLFLLAASSIASYFSIVNLIDSSKWVDRTHRVVTGSEEIISNLKDAETGQRGYLITRNMDFLEPYNGAYERTMNSLNKVRELTTDNAEQQRYCDSLELLINRRYSILRQTIDDVKMGKGLDPVVFSLGKKSMDDMRALVKRVQAGEQASLAKRTEELKRYTTYSPIVIIVAAVLAIVITIFFFKKVSDEFKEKTLLSEALGKKDEEIAKRIKIIQGVAQKIADGDYANRLNPQENDDLGVLAVSLDKMATSLDISFNKLTDNEWLQTGTAQLSQKIAGEKDVPELASDIIHFIAGYTHSNIGAIYLTSGDDSLKLAATYALNPGNVKQHIRIGEGLVGQAFENRGEILVNDIDESLYASSSAGEIKPKNIIVFPIFFEKKIKGIVELGSIHSYTELDLQYLRRISGVTGVVINTARNRARLKELLEETQAQAEELQQQHSELENLNVELESQAEKLQTSEEELRVQQEELMETNKALEERSSLLEEKNHLIAIRNTEIQKKAEELALSTKYKTEFLANMSHELRTPLNSILLLSRLMKENNSGNLSDEQVEYAQVIQSSGNSLLQLIDEILDLSKIESGKLELSYENASVEEIVNNMKMLFVPVARDKNIGFTVQVASDVPLIIETDKFRVEQVLKNLISNALKFTNQGAVGLNITLSSKYKGFIEFIVKDTGIGIPKEKQDAVFEAFQQADGSTKRNYGGTGLGLSISRQLARLLSGDISLRSEVNKGSEFTLYIPLGKHSALEIIEDPGHEIEKEDSSEPDIDMTNGLGTLVTYEIPQEIPDDRNVLVPGDKLLLIVEDDTSFAKAVLDFIRQKGYKGVVVVRGDEVIGAARMYKPTGILLDIQLPVKDGLQVMDELKAHSSTKHIPVHIMSSFEVRRETLGKGAIDFISKPLIHEQMDSVLEKIEAVMKNDLKKVLIVEDNSQHAKALSYFLSNYGIASEMSDDINKSVHSLQKKEINCVVLDMGIPNSRSYDALEQVKKNESLANIPIIIFTGKSLSRSEEQRIRQYADSIVIKTAHSYQRILDEVSLFLHMVESGNNKATKVTGFDNVLKDKTVLITDDDVRNIFALTKALEKHKMHVITTGNGKEALSALEENPPVDIVLMDIMMPEMDGYETITRIRKNSKWKKLPVIAVTAKAMTGDRERCMQAGASDYITKPVDTDQLISLMRIWLQETSR